ncbi:hypothetical protein HDV05_004630 [Chytridiales sp. JEL 0842]|nr:hypothetical protein HDV05_004630 [Chytridiales sp. JEL 0842]
MSNSTPPPAAATHTITTCQAHSKLHKHIRSQFPSLFPSKRAGHEAFKKGWVYVNGELGREAMVLQVGDVVEIRKPEDEDDVEMKSLPEGVEVLYEDSHMGIFWKPPGLPIGPQGSRTLTIAAKQHFARHDTTSSLHSLLKDPVALNTLPRASSGIVVYAKTVTFIEKLREKDHNWERQGGWEGAEFTWRCLVHGKVGEEEGLEAGEEMEVEGGGVDVPKDIQAVTKIRIVSFTETRNSTVGWLTTVDVTPISGFHRHQTQLHLAQISHPPIGTSRYSKKLRTARGLYASILSVKIEHPVTGEIVQVTKEEPDKFEAVRERESRFFKRKLESEGGDEKELQAEAKEEEGDDDEQDERGPGKEDGGQVKAGGYANTAYARGYQTFFNLQFNVTPDVMIPRPSSETLIKTALSHLIPDDSSVSPTPTPTPTQIRILDLGTGSGCLLLSTLSALRSHFSSTPTPPTLTGIGIDISPSALLVAQSNSKLHNLENSTSFLPGSFLTPFESLHQQQPHLPLNTLLPLDLILCNPPYLSPRKLNQVHGLHLNEEPQVALLGGKTGYEAYISIRDGMRDAERRCEELGVEWVRKGGWMVLEVGHGMGRRVRGVFEGDWWVGEPGEGIRKEEDSGVKRARKGDGVKLEGWEFVKIVRDQRGLERCVVFTRK